MPLVIVAGSDYTCAGSHVYDERAIPESDT
jgi:hypothetical protein